VHRARVTHRTTPLARVAKIKTVYGDKAKALVRSFNHLKREPKNYVTCDAAGGPVDTVIFRTPKHKWTVQQSACSQVQVQRDRQPLPTLLSSRKWSDAVTAALRG
jgi:hypothetical protein